MNIPLYVKTDPQMPRPEDPEYFLYTRDGAFLCRNHAFFASDVPVATAPNWLAAHQAQCQVSFPKVPTTKLEYIVGFFHRIYELHGSEAIVLLLWDLKQKRYRIVVPPQNATVWEAASGRRSALDVAYEVPGKLPPGCLVAASIHSHADGQAYSSWTDQKDEEHRDGVHVVCGHIERDVPEFHLEVAVDGHRFKLKFAQFFEGFRTRRTIVPQEWIDQVQCKVNRPYYLSSNSFWTDDRYGSGY